MGMNERSPGMLTREELSSAVASGEIDTVLTVCPYMYGRLMGKRITGHVSAAAVTSKA